VDKFAAVEHQAAKSIVLKSMALAVALLMEASIADFSSFLI
jgi:hypothetical protein